MLKQQARCHFATGNQNNLISSTRFPEPGPMILASWLMALAILVGGAFYLRRMEKTFADIV